MFPLSCSRDYKSTFLSDNYGKDSNGNGGLMQSCSEYFSQAAYGCGCPGTEPPNNGCGKLCPDGSPLPDGSLVVNAGTCQDLEIMSLFETEAKQCSRYHIFGSLCGCDEGNNASSEDCFVMEHLKNQTYYFFAGSFLYTISFGEDGYFGQIGSNDELYMIGLYQGTNNETNVATFVGGSSCGSHGPRSGTVAIVEDKEATEPTILNVIEPSTCVYHAELQVPEFCNKTMSANPFI